MMLDSISLRRKLHSLAGECVVESAQVLRARRSAFGFDRIASDKDLSAQ